MTMKRFLPFLAAIRSQSIDGGYSEWTAWADCSVTCWGGTQTRIRFCNTPIPVNGKDCSELGEPFDSQECNMQDCPIIDGNYTAWTEWSKCTVTCAGGKTSRSRTCTEPAPLNGGQTCIDGGLGAAAEELDCNVEDCPIIHGNYSDWSQWGVCSATCGGGKATRARTCDNPSPLNGGDSCVDGGLGEATDTMDCEPQACPIINGVWGEWGSWSACTTTCNSKYGKGQKTKLRECNNPAPLNGGTECAGDATEVVECACDSTDGSCSNCPAIDGAWSEWVTTACSATGCGDPATGTITKSRTCTNPAPVGEGMQCSGKVSDTELCDPPQGRCPVDGVWTAWSSWTTCQSKVTGKNCKSRLSDGTEEKDTDIRQWRTRTCTPPRYGGADCPTADCGASCEREALALDQQKGCVEDFCQDTIDNYGVNGGWGEWSTDWNTEDCDKVKAKGCRSWRNPTPTSWATTDPPQKKRSRKCNNPEVKFGGQPCSYTYEEEDPVGSGKYKNTTVTTISTWKFYKYDSCDETWDNCPTPIDAVLTNWGEWSKCQAKCNHRCKDGITWACTAPGVDTEHDKDEIERTRTCDALNGGLTLACNGQSLKETARCDGNSEGDGKYPKCDTDGAFSEWELWGECSTTCGRGTHTRTRACDDPPPVGAGKNCDMSEATHDEMCNEMECPAPIHGNWGSWGAFGTCTVTCGGGTRERSRNCDMPWPMYGGDDCVADKTETEVCNAHDCPLPVNGNWSEWGEWGTCSVTCANGTYTRSRSCDNPAPDHGGDSCPDVDPSEESGICNDGPCPPPVDGNWGTWSDWGECSKKCGTGTQQRSRTCDNPQPQHGGADCVVPADLVANDGIDEQNCNETPCVKCDGFELLPNMTCPIHGGWTTWSTWSACDVTCGGGTLHRHRKCSNPKPQFGGIDTNDVDQSGKDCDGDKAEQESCAAADCPVPIPDTPEGTLATGADIANVNLLSLKKGQMAIFENAKAKNFPKIEEIDSWDQGPNPGLTQSTCYDDCMKNVACVAVFFEQGDGGEHLNVCTFYKARQPDLHTGFTTATMEEISKGRFPKKTAIKAGYLAAVQIHKDSNTNKTKLPDGIYSEASFTESSMCDSSFKSPTGATCADFASNSWCTKSGDVGVEWKSAWGGLHKYPDPATGKTALACAECGCGQPKQLCSWKAYQGVQCSDADVRATEHADGVPTGEQKDCRDYASANNKISFLFWHDLDKDIAIRKTCQTFTKTCPVNKLIKDDGEQALVEKVCKTVSESHPALSNLRPRNQFPYNNLEKGVMEIREYPKDILDDILARNSSRKRRDTEENEKQQCQVTSLVDPGLDCDSSGLLYTKSMQELMDDPNPNITTGIVSYEALKDGNAKEDLDLCIAKCWQDDDCQFFSHNIETVTNSMTANCKFYKACNSTAMVENQGTNQVVRVNCARDECALNEHNCDENASCSDKTVGFECTCNNNYNGDGKQDGTGCTVCPSKACWNFNATTNECTMKNDCATLSCSGTSMDITFQKELYGVGEEAEWASVAKPVWATDKYQHSSDLGTENMSYTIDQNNNTITFKLLVALGVAGTNDIGGESGKTVNLGGMSVYNQAVGYGVNFECSYSLMVNLTSADFKVTHIAAFGANIGVGSLASGFTMKLVSPDTMRSDRFVMGTQMHVQIDWAITTLPALTFNFVECSVVHGSVSVNIVKDGCFAAITDTKLVTSTGTTSTMSYRVFKGLGQESLNQEIQCMMVVCEKDNCNIPKYPSQCPSEAGDLTYKYAPPSL